MATTRTKSVGSLYAGQTREYWLNAAKQFIWAIDFNDLQILVPESQLADAEQNLMVQHFRNAGWHVQSTLGCTNMANKIFNPKMNLPSRRYEEIAKRSEFIVGDRFRVLSSECELELLRVEKKLHLHYLNRPQKHDLLISEEQLKKSISFGLWIRI